MSVDGFEFTYFRGRVALAALLEAMDIGPGDEVATQALTCVAVPEAIMSRGARPLWVDIEPGGVNMDAADLAAKVTPRTRAVIIQHTYGIPADLQRLLEVADRLGLPVIEDCCPTHNSTWRGEPVGSFGVASFHSFEWGKPVVVGLGGAAIARDQNLREALAANYASYAEPDSSRVRRIRLQYAAHRHVLRPSLYWTLRSLYRRLGSAGLGESNYNPMDAGEQVPEFTWRMSRYHRRLLEKNLGELPLRTVHALQVADRYDELLKEAPVTHPRRPADTTSVLTRYPVFVEDKADLMHRAQQARVEIADWYSTPVHPLEESQWSLVYYEAASCPRAEAAAGEIVSLPVGPRVRQRDVENITGLLQRCAVMEAV